MFEPHELLEKLSAMVPAPFAHQTLFYGVFAAAAKLRPVIVPAPPPPDAPSPPTAAQALAGAPAGATPIATTTPRDQPDDSPLARKRRMAWASLLARVFDIDALACPRCGGRMEVIAVITKPDAVRAILAHLGLPTDAPQPHPPRAPPEAAASD